MLEFFVFPEEVFSDKLTEAQARGEEADDEEKHEERISGTTSSTVRTTYRLNCVQRESQKLARPFARK